MTAGDQRYVARRGSAIVQVVWAGGMRDLNPRLDLARHSPTGFGWGYEGSGPAQLALAMLADALGDDERARKLYQLYKSERIAKLNGQVGFLIAASTVRLDAAIIESRMAGKD